MLKAISSRKRYLFLSFLALFYFVLGAHALHPRYHILDGTKPDDSHHHQTSEIHHHPSIKGLVDSDDSPCPICSFFAVNSAIEINIVRFFIPSFPDQHNDNDCRPAVLLALRTGDEIRGPPATVLT